MRYLENDNLEEEVKEGVHVVDFYADWCGPCRMMGEVLEKIDDTDIIKVNVDKFSSLASKYGVMSIPKLVYFKDGNVVNETTGFMSLEDIKKEMDKLN